MNKIIILALIIFFNLTVFAQQEKQFKNQKVIAEVVLESIKNKNINMMYDVMINAEVLKSKVPALKDESSEMINNNIRNNHLFLAAFDKLMNYIDSTNIELAKIQITSTEVLKYQEQTSDIIPPKKLVINFIYEDKKGKFEIAVADSDEQLLYLVELINPESFFSILE